VRSLKEGGDNVRTTIDHNSYATDVGFYIQVTVSDNYLLQGSSKKQARVLEDHKICCIGLAIPPPPWKVCSDLISEILSSQTSHSKVLRLTQML
jgi:predicted nucleic acid-binding Zn ribbon protein